MIDVAAVNKIIHVVAKQLEVAPSEVAPHARFVEDLGADDVKMTDLFLALEEEFEVSLEGDTRQLATLSAVVHHLNGLL